MSTILSTKVTGFLLLGGILEVDSGWFPARTSVCARECVECVCFLLVNPFTAKLS